MHVHLCPTLTEKPIWGGAKKGSKSKEGAVQEAIEAEREGSDHKGTTAALCTALAPTRRSVVHLLI